MSSLSLGAGLAIAGGTAAAGGVASGVLGYEGAQGQASAANNAAELNYNLGEQSLGFQEQEYNTAQRNAAPWIQTGGTAELEMAQLLGLPAPSNGATPYAPFGPTQVNAPGTSSSTGQGYPSIPPPGSNYGNYAGPGGNTLKMSSLTQPLQNGGTSGVPGTGGYVSGGGPQIYNPSAGKGGPVTRGSPGIQGTAPANPNASNLQPFAPWTTPFNAPTAAQAAATPGEQFITQQGEQAINNAASAAGTSGDTNTARALVNYAENEGSTYYQQAYNNALQDYQQSYNIYQNNQANQWNRLASLAGMGQTQVNNLNSVGQNAAGNVGNILMGTGAQIGQNIQNAAAANASGYNAIGNSVNGGLGNLGSTLSLASLLGNNQNNYYAGLDASAG
jgi:hypothetical protein